MAWAIPGKSMLLVALPMALAVLKVIWMLPASWLKIHGFCFFWMLALPETNIFAPEMDGWKTIVSFRDGPFSGTC